MSKSNMIYYMIASCIFWFALAVFCDYLTSFRMGKDIDPDRYTNVQNRERIQTYDPNSVSQEKEIVEKLYKDLKSSKGDVQQMEVLDMDFENGVDIDIELEDR